MGIAGLLQKLKPAIEKKQLSEFRHKTIVIDALSWLHKATYCCSYDVVMNLETDKYLSYIMKRIHVLKMFDIVPVMVFDGRRAPLKNETSEKRRMNGKENLKLGLKCLEDAKLLSGKPQKKMKQQAYLYFQKAAKPTPMMIRRVMEELRRCKVAFMVAPYEADAQMVWQVKMKLASGILTEDSDLLVYCAAAKVSCPILFKLNMDTGMADVLSLESIQQFCLQSDNKFFKKLMPMLCGEVEAQRMLVQFCVLSGCDFIESLPRIGIMTAQTQIHSLKDTKPENRFESVLQQFENLGFEVPPDYLQRTKNAEALFYHHIIYDSIQKQCDYLVPQKEAFPDTFSTAMNGDTLHFTPAPFLGCILPATAAGQVYCGQMDPVSLELIHHKSLTTMRRPSTTMIPCKDLHKSTTGAPTLSNHLPSQSGPATMTTKTIVRPKQTSNLCSPIANKENAFAMVHKAYRSKTIVKPANVSSKAKRPIHLIQTTSISTSPIDTQKRSKLSKTNKAKPLARTAPIRNSQSGYAKRIDEYFKK